MIALNFDATPNSSSTDLPSTATATANLPPPARVHLPPSYRSALANRFTPSQLASLTFRCKPLFVYGSLMLPAQVARVLGDSSLTSTLVSQMTPAVLFHHERLEVRDCPFPAVVASVSADPTAIPKQVNGLLLGGLGLKERAMLNTYEGDLYATVPTKVEIEVVGEDDMGTALESERRKVMVDADVYVWLGTRAELLEPAVKEWELEGWLLSSMAVGLGLE